MRIGPLQSEAGVLSYEWVEHWARIPDTPSGHQNGRTHGVAVTKGGQVVVFNQANPAVLFFDANGSLAQAWGDRFGGAHGLTLVEEDGTEYLWLTDQSSTEVAKCTLDGQTVMTITRPDLALYQSAKYSPTWVAVNEERHGGNGDIWVTDGYGSSYIHRYDRHGEYLSSINGEEGKAGPFKCPHGIWVDNRKADPELYIADRSNKRVQVYDLDGNYKRVWGADFLTSPCGFAGHAGLLFIPELFARLAVLDGDDRLIGYLGANEAAHDLPGWPNLPAEQIHPGKFNSPHGMTADTSGNLFIVEWIIGGRITKLDKQS